MKKFLLTIGAVLLSLAGTACQDDQGEAPYVPVELVEGSPQAGVAQDFLRLPAGVPLGAYTARDTNLGLGFGPDATKPYDNRNSPWSHKFFPSAGNSTGISLDVVWLTNGDRDMVLISLGLGAAYDGLVHALEAELGTLAGRDLTGQVLLTTTHSHSAPGGQHGSMHFAPGFDRYDPRLADRIVTQVKSVAQKALDTMEPVEIGVGVVHEFDPIGVDEVFRDRRSQNDTLDDHHGHPTGAGHKDPSIHVIKIQKPGAGPLAVVLQMGIHGTLFGASNHWTHWDAPGAIAHGLSTAMGGTPVIFLQGSGGDISPVRVGPAFAAADRLARVAAEKLEGFVGRIETSGKPFTMDMAGLTIPQSLDKIVVKRQGLSNFRYSNVNFNKWGEPDVLPDNIIWDTNGDVIELVDEFAAPAGAALCAPDSGSLLAAMGMGIVGAEVSPYADCAVVEQVGRVITDLYEINHREVFTSDENGPRNIEPGMSTTMLSFGHIGNVPVTHKYANGTVEVREGRVAMLFLPGETCTLLGLRGAHYLKELGYESAIMVAYAQDHEGYLMTVEDWLMGGYEPGINAWGPLQGEYILESALPLAERGLEPFQIRTDDIGIPAVTSLEPVGFESLPETRQTTPKAGSILQDFTEHGLMLPADLPYGSFDPQSPPTSVRAYTDHYYAAFEGGDVSIDSPVARLQRRSEAGFKDVDLGEGVVATTRGPGMLLGYTPSPVNPTDAFVSRRHLWVLVWQPLGEGVGEGDWAKLPLGEYRFVVEGKAIREEGAEPQDYSLELPPFQVVSAEVLVAATDDGFQLSYGATELGMRLRGVLGDPRAATPIPRGTEVEVRCTGVDTVWNTTVGESGKINLNRFELGDNCTLVDAYGNTAAL